MRPLGRREVWCPMDIASELKERAPLLLEAAIILWGPSR